MGDESNIRLTREQLDYIYDTVGDIGFIDLKQASDGGVTVLLDGLEDESFVVDKNGDEIGLEFITNGQRVAGPCRLVRVSVIDERQQEDLIHFRILLDNGDVLVDAVINPRAYGWFPEPCSPSIVQAGRYVEFECKSGKAKLSWERLDA